MGEHKLLRCETCNEYANVGKIRPEFDEGHFPGDRELTISFLYEHQGCRVRLVGEYGGTQQMWLNTREDNGWEEYKISNE
jgi:hypothetical protein